MSQSIDRAEGRLLALTGKAGLTTLTAQAIGVNLGLVGVAQAQRQVSPFSFAIIADPHLYSAKDHVFDKQLEDAVTQVNAHGQAARLRDGHGRHRAPRRTSIRWTRASASCPS